MRSAVINVGDIRTHTPASSKYAGGFMTDYFWLRAIHSKFHWHMNEDLNCGSMEKQPIIIRT